MINLEALFEIYIDSNLKIEIEKSNKLETFRGVEAELKQYVYTLSELEKMKIESSVMGFDTIYNDMVDRLLKFNPLNLESNLDPVKIEYHKLIDMKDDLKNVSSKIKKINNIWDAFISRNKNIDLESEFILNITSKIDLLKELFKTVQFNEISRIEDELGDLNRNIQRTISMIEDLKVLLSENTFIGEYHIELRDTIHNFITNEYRTLNLLEMNERYFEINEKIKIAKSMKKTKTEKVEVVKIYNSGNKNIYNYGIEFYGVFMNLSDVEEESMRKVKLNEYIYIDNFPVQGIFRNEDFKDTIEISDKQFYAIQELSINSFRVFMLFVLSALTLLSLTATGELSPIISVPLVIAINILFIITFKGLRLRNDSYNNMHKMFYFFKINYLVTSLGDDLFKYNKIIPKIFLNFDEIIKNRDSRNG